ncbi:MAG: hypothetical protein AB7I33_17580 [Gemmatimonadales bacterium]
MVRFLDSRELVELVGGTLAGVALVWMLNRLWPGLFSGRIRYREWLGIGAGVGFLLAALWSAHKVEQKLDYRIPMHVRRKPTFRDGRPIGVIAWRTRDAAMEYLFLVMGVVVVLLILWLAKTYL